MREAVVLAYGDCFRRSTHGVQDQTRDDPHAEAPTHLVQWICPEPSSPIPLGGWIHDWVHVANLARLDSSALGA